MNIFFISGMCYLVLALYRKFNVKLGGYIISALIVGIVTPFTKLLVSDNQALNWLLDMTFGEKVRQASAFSISELCIFRICFCKSNQKSTRG